MTPELLIGLTSVLAFYLAWNLGANDVANSMGTSVGSKAITLKQAIVIAGILELGGALLLGQRVSGTLATQVVQPESLAASPQLFVVGMIMVLVTCGLWLQIATSRGWPVSSSHATLGAIAGFGWMAAGAAAVNWRLSRSAGDRPALETVLGRFQVISACFVAFARGSSDVGNAIAPLAAFAYTQRTGRVPGA